MDVEYKIRQVFDLYDRFGHEAYIGEEVSQLQHAQQCAQAALKAANGQPDHAILGAFLHDIGHLVGLANKMEAMSDSQTGCTLGTKTHEKVGQDFLGGLGFPKSVTDFVRGHVEAKRYLVYRYPSYHDSLSQASKGTLINQGGPMTKKEAEEFEKRPDFESLLLMRNWDDAAKDASIAETSNEFYKDLCRKILMTNSSSQ